MTGPAGIGRPEDERDGGRCAVCAEPARLLTCDCCGESRWTIDCGHYSQPRPLAAGGEGLPDYRAYCEVCVAAASFTAACGGSAEAIAAEHGIHGALGDEFLPEWAQQIRDGKAPPTAAYWQFLEDSLPDGEPLWSEPDYDDKVSP